MVKKVYLGTYLLFRLYILQCQSCIAFYKYLQEKMRGFFFSITRHKLYFYILSYLFTENAKSKKIVAFPASLQKCTFSNLPLLFSLPNGTETNGGMQLTSLQLTFSSEII